MSCIRTFDISTNFTCTEYKNLAPRTNWCTKHTGTYLSKTPMLVSQQKPGADSCADSCFLLSQMKKQDTDYSYKTEGWKKEQDDKRECS